MNQNAILFDLDNTLADRTAGIRRYAQRFCEDFSEYIPDRSFEQVVALIQKIDHGGYPTEALPKQSIKQGLAHALHLAFREDVETRPHPAFDVDDESFNTYNDALKLDSDLERSIMRHVYEHFHSSAVAADGAEKLLKRLKKSGWKLGVVSNGSEESRQATIDALGFRDYFDVIISSGAVGLKKPEVEIFDQARMVLEATADECFFVGDHPVNDIDGARRAGIRAIWLRGFHAWPEEIDAPEWSVDFLSNVPFVLKAAQRGFRTLSANDLSRIRDGQQLKKQAEQSPELKRIGERASKESFASEFAAEKHANQFYDEHPYSFHLAMTAGVAKDHDLSLEVIIACWLHDTIEDCRVSFHELKELFGDAVAELVYCVTDELGRNRKERKAKTYPKILANEKALQLKLCDRIANFSHALTTKSRHLEMYRKEYPEFRAALYSKDHCETTLQLWMKLDELNETPFRN